MALAKSALMPTRQLDKAEMCHVVKLALDTLSGTAKAAIFPSSDVKGARVLVR